jgi:hypothetical protein
MRLFRSTVRATLLASRTSLARVKREGKASSGSKAEMTLLVIMLNDSVRKKCQFSNLTTNVLVTAAVLGRQSSSHKSQVHRLYCVPSQEGCLVRCRQCTDLTAGDL